MAKKTIDQQILELEKQVAEEETQEVKEETKPEEEEPEETEAEPTDDEEKGGEEDKAPQSNPALEIKPLEAKDSQGQAWWEVRELRRKLAEKEAAEKAKEVKPVEQDPAPNKEEEPIAYLEWEVRQAKKTTQELLDWKNQQEQKYQAEAQMTAQEQNFASLESQFSQTVDDYEEVSAHMVNEMARYARGLSPTATPQQIGQFVKGQILAISKQFEDQGIHPIAALYNMGKTQYGYQPKAPEIVQNNEPQKPSLSQIEKNKKKSANGLGGQSNKATTTAEAVAKMSISDMERLPPEERRELGLW